VLPHQAQQLLPGEGLAGPAAELQQQPQLGRGQLEVGAVLRHGHGGAVDDDRAERRRVVGVALAAPHHRADAGVEHAALHRLDHVVVGAGLQAHDHVDVIATRGEQDDRQLVGAPDAAADLEAVDPGQHHVQHDQVRALLAQQLQAVLTRRGGHHAVALASQAHLQGGAYRLVVLYQQQESHAGHCDPWTVRSSTVGSCPAVRRGAWPL
jgi:hypothetical protein